MASPGFTRAQQRPVRSGAPSQQLLPGIPNEITLYNIAPKLSWRDFYILSLVSPAWWQANRSRQVYDARVRSQSTETLAVLNYSPCQDTSALALFSSQSSGGRFCWELPPIPGFERGIPRWCGCVALDGKVYILGGLNSICQNGKGKVFVMDLAGQTGWRKCKSMEEARQSSGCCVKDGKIYVFGGMIRRIPIGSSEVYDPNEDIWTPSSPMPSLRYLHNVELMGDEFVIHYGHGWEFKSPLYQLTNIPDVWEFYNPGKDKWTRTVRPYRQYSTEMMFISEGKYHVLHGNTLAIYHGEEDDWLSTNDPFANLPEARGKIGKRSFSFAAMGGSAPVCFFPLAILPLNDELLVTLEIYKVKEGAYDFRTYVILGKRFRSSNEEISMEFAPFFEFKGYCNTKQFIVPIEL